MAVMVWDSNNQAFADAEPPLAYNQQLDSWQDTEGLVYNHELDAWKKVWPADVKVYMDATLGWPQPVDGIINEVGGFANKNADGSYTIRAQDYSDTVQGFKGITFEPPKGCTELHVTVDGYNHNNGNGYITFAVVAGNELEFETIQQSQLILNTTVRGTGWDQPGSVALHEDTAIDISGHRQYKYFCIQTAAGSAWGAVGWTEITISNIYFR